MTNEIQNIKKDIAELYGQTIAIEDLLAKIIKEGFEAGTINREAVVKILRTEKSGHRQTIQYANQKGSDLETQNQDRAEGALKAIKRIADYLDLKLEVDLGPTSPG